MKKTFNNAASTKLVQCPRSATRGFTLIELILAMGMFLLVAGVGFSLFNQHVKAATRQQNLSGINIGLRNAMSQMEMDLSSAGTNLLSTVQGGSVFGIGVNVTNNVPASVGACAPNTTNWSYPFGSACYDALAVPSIKPCTATGGSTAPVLSINDPSPEVMSSNTTILATDYNVGANYTNDASCFQTGDELLILQFPAGGRTQTQCATDQFNYCVTAVTLTANATVSGSTITLLHNVTGTNGQAKNCPGASCSDPLGIIGAANFTNAQAASFSAGASSTLYVINLGGSANTITYSVQANPNNADDPQLMRCVGGTCASVMDQVIGFKIGAALWNNQQATGTDIANYFYNAANYCNGSNTNCSVSPPPANDPYDFSLIRAVRISMVARTTPTTDITLNAFANGFDGGPYLVQQASVVVDLRNMSNNELGN